MNKKFLNAVLIGALLASSTGTFTSCKDYDDDINGLNERVDAVEKTLAELNGKFGSLAYVKSVSFANGVLTVTDQNGQTTSFEIPDRDTDTNTTYTLDVTSTREGNVTTVTVTLTGSDGSSIVKTFTITDNDTVIEDTDTQLDPTKFWMDAEGVMWYGTKGDKEKSVKTGVVVPQPEQHNKTAVTIVNYKNEDGVVVGWEVKVDDKTTKLLIQDILPITGFEYIPETVLSGWGERVIVFKENSYTQKAIINDAVSEVTPAKTLYMSNLATPQFEVNPGSATIAQLQNNGEPVIKKKDVSLETRTPGKFIEWKNTIIDKGIMTVSLEADPSLFAKESDKLNTIALQFTTTANNTITTEYVGVINKDAEVDLRLTDNTVTAEKPGEYKQHYSTAKSIAVNQIAKINGANMPDENNNYLVQNITYSKAIAGINPADYVSVCNVEGEGGHEFFDYKKYTDLKLVFETVKYDVAQTPQDKYMQLTEAEGIYTLKGVNYGGINQSCIGKAPMVLAKLIDTHNNNALVSAAYIKFLIVGDAAADPEKDITIAKDPIVLGVGCNKPNYTWSTNDEFMSTEVYTFAHQETANKLTALSKEQFHLLYQFTSDAVAGYSNKGTWEVKEILNSDDSKANHGATFTLKNSTLAAGTYYAYAIYKKTEDSDIILSITDGAIYPKYVVIKHEVKVDAVNFAATAGQKVANAWNDDQTMASIYCQTPGGNNATKIIGDLNELFVGGAVKFVYDNNFDNKKYPDFIQTNMDYHFEFSVKNLKKDRGVVEGLSGNKYQLVVSDDYTKLYAIAANAATTTVTDEVLVASLSGELNEDVEYAQTVVAKDLLNKEPRGDNSFYAIMDIVYENGCGFPVDVTNGEFKLAFIRPVNAASNSDKFFTDGLNVGDASNILKLGELVNFTDWRKDSPLNSFAAHKDYYKYYGVTSIKCDDITKVETDWTGERLTLDKAFGTELANKIIKIEPKNVEYNAAVTEIPDFGTVTYLKTSGAEIKSYKLFIPVTITYKWGTMKEVIEVVVKATK